MRLYMTGLVMITVLGLFAGCARERRQSPMERQIESLRQSGYGFNNPNVEAARERARR